MLPDVDSKPIFDQDLALDLLEGDIELLNDVLELYKETSLELVTNLLAAASGQNFVEVSEIAHSLKGASANVCAQRVYALAAFLEDDCRSGSPQIDVQDCCTQIQGHLQVFNEEIDSKIEQ